MSQSHTDPCGGFFVSLQIPSIFQWHPFSCYPTNDGHDFDCWVRALGGWTSRLAFELSPVYARLGGVSAADWPMRGCSSDVLLVAGGTGVVTFLGILSSGPPHPGNVTLVSSIRHVQDIFILKTIMGADKKNATIVVHFTGKKAGVADVVVAELSRDDDTEESYATSDLTTGTNGRVVIATLYLAPFLGAIFGVYLSQDDKFFTDEKTHSWKRGLINA